MSKATLKTIEEGYKARREGRAKDAHRLFLDAIRSARAAGDANLLVDALRGLANSESDLGRMDKAAERYREAVAILRGMNDPQRLAHTVRHLADVTRLEGRKELSVACYNEALGLYRADDATKPLDLANALRGFGLLREELGDRAAARMIWEEALRLYTDVGIEAGVEEAKRRVADLTGG